MQQGNMGIITAGTILIDAIGEILNINSQTKRITLLIKEEINFIVTLDLEYVKPYSS